MEGLNTALHIVPEHLSSILWGCLDSDGDGYSDTGDDFQNLFRCEDDDDDGVGNNEENS